MNESDLNIVIDNDREWRKYILKKMEKIEEDQQSMLVTMTTLKLKYGVIATIFGGLSSAAVTYAMSRMAVIFLIFFSSSALSLSEYSVNFKNGTHQQKQKIIDSLILAHEKMQSDVFKFAVINYTRPDGSESFYQTDKSNEQVYNALSGQKWEYSIEFYSRCVSTANAYVIPNEQTVYLNWCKISNNENRSIANTLVHEYTHVLGFSHDYRPTANRPFTVPYAIGSIVEKLLGGEEILYYVPWYKRLINKIKGVF
jgi:hypothetical protein